MRSFPAPQAFYRVTVSGVVPNGCGSPGLGMAAVFVKTLFSFYVVLAVLLAGGVGSRPVSAQEVQPAAQDARLYTFTPARAGESLAQIASYLIPAPEVSLEQMMWALFQHNPQAFDHENIHGIKRRPTLNIPPLQLILDIDPRDAQQRLVEHQRRWAALSGEVPLTTRDVPVARPKDDERPEDQFSITLLGRPLTVGGEIELESRYRQDRSLGRRDDDDSRIGLGLQLELLYTFSKRASFYLELDPRYRAELHSEDGQTEEEGDIELDEVWLYLRPATETGFSVRVGRQYLGDDREWWLDGTLNAVRLLYDAKPLKLQFTVGSNPRDISLRENGIDPEDDDIFWLIGHAHWRWTKKQQFEIFMLSRIDRSSSPEEGETVVSASEDDIDATLNWLGLRQSGRLKFADWRWHYWLDLGMLAGRETVYDFDSIDDRFSVVDGRLERNVNGWGFDAGGTWELPWPLKPRLTLAYAVGSGDDSPDDNTDSAYRQSGLHGNSDRYRGVNSFRYYGELLRPELSNLRISTIALGFPLLSRSSLEIVHHRYSQRYAYDELRDSGLRTDPTGDDTDIGREVNIILGFKQWKHLDVELTAAQFRAGDAYGEFAGRTASSATLELDYSF